MARIMGAFAPTVSVLLVMAALVATGLGSSPASAQISSGVSGSSSLFVIESDEEYYQTLSAFGACFAARKSAEALALIATEPGSSGEMQTYRQRIRRASVACLSDTDMRAPIYLVRGAIAEGLYERGVALPPEMVLSAPPPGAPMRTLAEMTRCYTANHRDQVRALIDQTRIGSREEYDLLSEMAPDFVLCVPERFREVEFSAPVVRARMAEALYRMPTTPLAAAGGRQ